MKANNTKNSYLKNLWNVRVNGENIIVKATQEQLEDLWKQDKITDYTMLKVFNISTIEI